jgi:hypothetical protein
MYTVTFKPMPCSPAMRVRRSTSSQYARLNRVQSGLARVPPHGHMSMPMVSKYGVPSSATRITVTPWARALEEAFGVLAAEEGPGGLVEDEEWRPSRLTRWYG